MHEMEKEPLAIKSAADLKTFQEQASKAVGGSTQQLDDIVAKVNRMISGNAPWVEELPAFVQGLDSQNTELMTQLGEQTHSRERRLGLADQWIQRTASSMA